MRRNKKSTFEPDLLYNWGNERLTKKHQEPYLSYFKDVPGTVLEIGCGRGVFLGLLKDAGIDAYGIDSSEQTVRYCRKKGLHALHGDAFNHLASLSRNSLGGIFCGHVIEHLEPTYAVRLIKESYRVLKRGGRLIIITPNPKDLRTTERFWLDITHVRLYPEKLLVTLLKREGFTRIRVLEGREPARNPLEKMAKLFLKAWFMGFMYRGDLIVMAERGK